MAHKARLEAEFKDGRDLREAHGISLRDVAKRMSKILKTTVGSSTIHGWEKGITHPANTENGRARLEAWRKAMRQLMQEKTK